MIQRVIICCIGLALPMALVERVRAADDPVQIADDGRVTLVAKASAREGGKLSFFWKWLEGPEEVKIADPGAARLDDTDQNKRRWISETYFIPNKPGVYRFELSVKNDDGKESKKIFEKEVLPPKPAPVAVAGQDQNNRQVDDLIRLDGSNSKCPEGAIALWQWDVVQAPPKFRPDPELLKKSNWDFTAKEAGIYQFTLRVSDGTRWSAPSPPVVITVKPKSLPPFIEPDESDKKVRLPAPAPNVVQAPPIILKPLVAPGGDAKVGQTLVLDGSASHPPAEMNPQFFWHQTDDSGPVVRELRPDQGKAFDARRHDANNYPVWTFKPEKPGTYSFALKLTVNETDYESETVTYTVIDPNTQQPANPPIPPVPAAGGQALVARLSADSVNVDVGDMVRLDASRSTGPKGAKLKFIWAPVNGKLYPHEWTGADGPQIEFKADDEGEYGIALMVSDGDHKSAPDQIIITAGPAKGPPLIDLPAEYNTTVHAPITIEARVSDPKHDQVSLKWICIDPPDLTIKDPKSTVDISTLPSLKFDPYKAGRFVFKLTATDSKGHSATAVTTVNVKTLEDHEPTATLDGPKQVFVGSKVVIDGSGSRTANNLPLSYLWKQEAGPTIPGDAPGKKQRTWDFTPKEAGQYKFSLQVSDANAKSQVTYFSVNVVAEQHTLVAKIAGPAAVKLNAGDTITLDGSDSSDGADGKTKLKFKWSKLDGTADLTFAGEDAPKVKLTGASSGPARVQLVISDGTSESQPAIVVVNVGRERGKATAKISGPAEARVNAVVALSGEGSTPGEGEITTWEWKQTGESPNLKLSRSELRKKELRFEPKQPGTYVFTLTVVDEKGNKSEPETFSVEVKAGGGANKQPVARAGLLIQNNAPLAANNPVKLSARGSTFPENHPKYKWKQVGGEPVQMPDDTSEIINVVPPAPGKYTFELVVSDGDIDSAPQEISFNVEGPRAAPEAKIADIQPVDAGERIVLDGSESKAADGAKLEYRWTRVSGPEARFVGRNAESKPKAEVLLQADGEYVFELKVFDGKDWSEAARATVKTRAPNIAPIAVISSPNNGKVINTEENMETILDGSESNDPDNGPKPLTYIWKQSGGARADLRSEGKIARFTPSRMGQMKFDLVVNDGKASSAPFQVVVNVLKAGTLPVAVPDYTPKPAKAANRNLKNNLLILDGTKSRPANTKLAYQWKQIGGDDLRLKPEKLNKDRIGLLVYQPGVYKFTLTVSDSQNTSQPAVLEFNVIDDSPTVVAPPAAPAPPTTDGAQAPGPDRIPEATQKQPDKSEAAPPDSKAPAATATASPPTSPVDAGPRDGALLPPPRDANIAQTKEAASNPDRAAEKKRLEELSRQSGPDADGALIEALSNPDKELRKLAAEALYSRGASSIPALISALDSSSANARNEAFLALKELTHETFGPESDKWKAWWDAQQQPVAKSSNTKEQSTP